MTWECQRGFRFAEQWKKDEGRRASTTEFHQKYRKKKNALCFSFVSVVNSLRDIQPVLASDARLLISFRCFCIADSRWLKVVVFTVIRVHIYPVCFSPRSRAWRHMFLTVHPQLPPGLSLQSARGNAQRRLTSSSSSIISGWVFIFSGSALLHFNSFSSIWSDDLRLILSTCGLRLNCVVVVCQTVHE